KHSTRSESACSSPRASSDATYSRLPSRLRTCIASRARSEEYLSSAMARLQEIPHPTQQRIEPGSGHGRERDRFRAPSLELLAKPLGFGLVHQIDFRKRHQGRLGREILGVLEKLAAQDLEIARRILRARLDQEHENLGALDVAQELVPQPLSLVRPFDEPGQVGEDDLPLLVQRRD